MKTKILRICLLLTAFTVTGCGHDLNETAVETEILSQTESSVTETETEVITKAMTTMTSNAKAEDYIGEWEYDNIVLFISNINQSYYLGSIISFEDPESTDVYDSWEYELQYRDGKMICNGKGRRYHNDMNNPLLSIETKYLNGNAEFTLSTEGIIWNDMTEHYGDSMLFKYSETQPEILS